MPGADFARFLADAAARPSLGPRGAAVPLGAGLRHQARGHRRPRQPDRGSRPRSRRRALRGRGPLSRRARMGAHAPRTCSGAARGWASMSAATPSCASRRCWAGPWRRSRPRPPTHEPAPGPGPPHRRQGGLDRHPVARPAGRPALRAARADPGRQDLADAPDGRARPAERRPHPGRRRRRHRHVGAQARRGHGLPAVHQLPDPHRLRQHRLAPAPAGRARGRGRRQGQGDRPAPAHRPSARPDAGGALRRPAAAPAPSPAPWSSAPRCSCSTSPWSISTTSCARSCAPSCATCSPASRRPWSTPPPSRSRR